MTSSAARFLVAPDSFKGTFDAADVAEAITRGLHSGGCEVADVCPVADGGEGTMDVIASVAGGRYVTHRVHDPLERPIEARFVLLDDGETAVVDTAQASGLHLTSPDERDPERATTRGTGELLAAAIDQGARRILIAAGGSATTDGGIGAIEAIERGGGLQGARLDVLCDVDSPFERAADTFGPQKGADPETIKRLTTRLHQQAAAFPRNPIGVPMTGCAGGLSGGLWAVFDARLRPGADYVFQILNLPSSVLGADAVISGEGRLDPQSFDGKVVGALTELCRASRTELHVIVGTSLLSPSQARQLGLASLRVAGTLDAICTAARQIAVDCHPARHRPS